MATAGYRLVGCLLTAASLCVGLKYKAIECPYPEGTSVSTEARCHDFSACDWTKTRCHMSDAIEASYSANGVDVNLDTGTKQFYWTKPKRARTMFNNVVMDLAMHVIPHEDYHFQIKIVDRNAARYEVPIPLSLPAGPGQSPTYDVAVGESAFGFRVHRKETGAVILSTAGPLTYEDQFIQITFKLSSTYLYGLGENTHMTLRHVFEPRTTFPMWSRGQYYTQEPKSLMGLHPLFTVIEDSAGHAHSVFFLNSNAMESSTFLLDDGSPALTLRAIGGVIDMHVFMGPTPEDLNKQYIKMIGFPSLPPYYYLGFQLSRYGYNGTDHIRDVVRRNREAGVPQDVQTVDIDYMSNFRAFTYDTLRWGDLPQLADELHQDDLRLTLVLDHPIVVDWDNYPPGRRGKERDAFVKWPSPFLVPSDQFPSCANFVLGYMWPDNKTVFPDFLLPEARQWWADEIVAFHQSVRFDDLWLDLNEPNNFGTDLARPENYPPGLPAWSLRCPDNRWEDPPYPTMTVRITDNESKRISDSTLCMSSVQRSENTTFKHYDVHALYGLTHSEATIRGLHAALPHERSMVLGAATYPGYGKYGAHWLGDNRSSWNHMRLSIIGLIEMNMFGIPMVGADVCGHLGQPSGELCARWTQLGAFYSFSRNHNNEGNHDQDPAYWGSPVTDICREALLTRYTYLPFLYTLLYKASREGSSVLRPLWNVFPGDVGARDVQDQFLWGAGLMVAPVLEEGATHRDVYFPKGRWYDLLTGQEIPTKGTSQSLRVSAPLEVIPLYLCGGSIIPAQQPDIRTALSRKNPMTLVVALDGDHSAAGDFFWDDGGSRLLTSTNSQLASIQFSHDKLTYAVSSGSVADQGLVFNRVKIVGDDAARPPQKVFLNGLEMDSCDWVYDQAIHSLVVSLTQPISEDFQIVIGRNEIPGDSCN